MKKPKYFNEINKFDRFIPDEGMLITFIHDWKGSRNHRITYYRDGWWWTSAIQYKDMTRNEMLLVLGDRIKQCKEFAYQFMNKERLEVV